MEPQLPQARAEAITRTAILGGFVNFVLSSIKVAAGILWHSQALVADGIHSFSDLLSDVLVWFAGRQSMQAPDLEHPYGHERYETLTTLILGVFLLVVAIGIGWDAGERLFAPDELLRPEPLAFVAVVASIIVKEWLYWWTLGYAKRVRSNLLRANAWHHRSDAVSSVIVLVGIGGTLAGLPYLDAIAAFIVAVMIAGIARELGWGAIQELVDTGLESERLEEIKDTILGVGGVRDIHMLRTRRHGGQASADVHVLVDPRVSVSEGHMIALLVETGLKERIDEITDVTVHIDPENDAVLPAHADLPMRAEALVRLGRLWDDVPEAAGRQRTILHYLGGRIDVEVFFPLDACAGNRRRGQELRERLQSSLKRDPDFHQVFVYFG